MFEAIGIPGYTILGIVGLMFWASFVLLVGDYINGNTINILVQSDCFMLRISNINYRTH